MSETRHYLATWEDGRACLVFVENIRDFWTWHTFAIDGALFDGETDFRTLEKCLDDVREWARPATVYDLADLLSRPTREELAVAVERARADEREACAAIADVFVDESLDPSSAYAQSYDGGVSLTAEKIAADIRARGGSHE